MQYIKTQKYDINLLNQKIMGPDSLKLEEKLMKDNRIKAGAVVMDLGNGQGITSVFLVKKYGCKVYATDLWRDAEENQKFFAEMGLTEMDKRTTKKGTPTEFQKSVGAFRIISRHFCGERFLSTFVFALLSRSRIR